MKRKFPRRPQLDQADINITPMLDIVFIMLIFFIVTTSFTRDTGVQVIRPPAENAVALLKGTILIGVTAGNEIWMAKQRIELPDVRHRVERARAENPAGSVVVVADRGASIGVLTQVMDQVRLAGVEGVAISAERPGGQPE